MFLLTAVLLKGIFCLKIINFLFYRFCILNGKSKLDFKRISLDSFFVLFFFNFYINVVFISAIQQHKSAIFLYIYPFLLEPPSLTPILPLWVITEHQTGLPVLYSNFSPTIHFTHDQIRSDQISRSVVSDSLRPHESQHARPPCPSPTPGVHSDSRSSSQ